MQIREKLAGDISKLATIKQVGLMDVLKQKLKGFFGGAGATPVQRGLKRQFNQGVNTKIPMNDTFFSNPGEEALTKLVTNPESVQNRYQKLLSRTIQGGDRFVSGNFDLRNKLVRRYGWSVPTDEALQEISKHGPAIEVGAGKGYWSKLLQDKGTKITPYDIDVAKGSGYTDAKKRFTDISPSSAGTAVRDNPDKNVFMSWPPYNSPVGYEAARYVQPGKRLFLVGEGRGGATGDDALYDFLHKNFTLEKEITIPSFYGIRDSFTTYKRNHPIRKLAHVS